jgi:soluble lytic murein transglycosylase-like protein
MLIQRSLIVAFALVVAARPAAAQIFAWQDVNGRWVYSDKSIDRPTDVYVVEGAPETRATRPVESLDSIDRYEPFILEYSNRHALRPELVRAVIQVELGFDPRARSPKGAMGLMQLMPATARTLGVRNPYDPEDNIRGGTRYLRLLLDRYNGDERLALAAYNAGSGAVDRYGGTVPPYRETREYLKKVGSAANGTRTPGRAPVVIYKTIEVVDNRAVPHYSDEKPVSGSYEVVH